MQDNTLRIIKVLFDTDKEHPLTQGQIANRIIDEKGKPLDRKTVNAAFKRLLEAGFDIVASNKRGYYLDSRIFNVDEALILLKTIGDSSLSLADKRHFAEAIRSLFSDYTAKQLKAQVPLKGTNSESSITMLEDIRAYIDSQDVGIIYTKDGQKLPAIFTGLTYSSGERDYVLDAYAFTLSSDKEHRTIKLGDIDRLALAPEGIYTNKDKFLLSSQGFYRYEWQGLTLYSFLNEAPTMDMAESAYYDLLPYRRAILKGRPLPPITLQKAIERGRVYGAFDVYSLPSDDTPLGKRLRHSLLVFISALIYNGRYSQKSLASLSGQYIDLTSDGRVMSKPGQAMFAFALANGPLPECNAKLNKGLTLEQAKVLSEAHDWYFDEMLLTGFSLDPRLELYPYFESAVRRLAKKQGESRAESILYLLLHKRTSSLEEALGELKSQLEQE